MGKALYEEMTNTARTLVEDNRNTWYRGNRTSRLDLVWTTNQQWTWDRQTHTATNSDHLILAGTIQGIGKGKERLVKSLDWENLIEEVKNATPSKARYMDSY